MPNLLEKKQFLPWLRKNLLTVLFFLMLGIVSSMSLYATGKAYATHTAINNQSGGEGNSFETDLSGSLFGKFTFLNLNGAMRRLLGQREMNGIVRLNNGYLADPTGPVDESLLADNAEHVSRLNSALAARDIPLLYVVTPFKISPNDPELPTGVTDSTNENMDVILNHLRADGITCMDLREAFNQNGIDPYSYFYRTDHHWNTRGGFYAYTQLVPLLEAMLDTTVDPALSDLNNYTITNYPRWHLGAYGQRTGQFFGGVDDFEVIEPSFDTRLDRYRDFDLECSGTFSEVVYNTLALQQRDLTQRYTYDITLIDALSHFRNENAASDKKLLVIGDSMMKAVNPYLVLSFREVYSVDAYHPEQLTAELLDKYQPDLVLLVHYPTLLYTSDYFQFGIG